MSTLRVPSSGALRPSLPVTLAPPASVLRVALAGCGTVGGALAAQLIAVPHIGRRRVEIVKVLVRDPRKARTIALRPGVVTDSLAAFLSVSCDVVVETIGGREPARTIVAAALVQGRRVVTANKALVAAEGASLASLAARFGGQLDFEGAVGGCLPVVRALRSGAAGVGVTRIRGVLNGTSNFVLDRVMRGASPADAIREAQQLGFAEADPSRDLDGIDASDKIAILAWLTFGVAPHMLPVVTRSLADALALAPFAAHVGARVAQLAECAVTEQGLVARVEPALVGLGHDLARASGESNAVTVESASAGTILFAGRGAGGDPTAGALHGDLGTMSPPLPTPRAVHLASRDDRVLSWVMLVHGETDDAREAIEAHVTAGRATSSTLTAHARLLAFSESPAGALEWHGVLARLGATVALARDMR